MQKSLYDILEVSKSASSETIRHSYEHLTTKYRARLAEHPEHAEEATMRLTAIKEAFHTLGNPENRQRYDDRLEQRASAQAIAIQAPAPSYGFIKIGLIVALLGGSGLYYQKLERDQEAARLEAAKVAAEQAEKQRQAEEERVRALAEDKQRREAQMEAQRIRAEFASAQHQADNSIRLSQSMEARNQMIQKSEERQRAMEEKQRVYEAQRQLERDKATIRQMQYENSRNGAHY